ncbi:MAG: sodium/solute symporter [Alphaproteobacteria bacterium]|nr:sodium/solute symporter [Alphaproteobacteria bacterium]
MINYPSFLLAQSSFGLHLWDYIAIALFFIILSVVGYLAGRGERASSEEYFLAGKKLPWYVVGGSFIASNISSDQFIGMVGAAMVYGVCVSLYEWANVATFAILIWFFVPFLLGSKVFTTPEYLEKRFSPTVRTVFAVVTIISNVVAFLAAVLYGGALALHELFGWDLWPSIIGLGIVAGVWAVYGGLSSVAWTDLFTVAVMLVGGIVVTVLGLQALAPEGGGVVDGFQVMLERNEATSGKWAEAVQSNTQELAGTDTYNRLSVIQPATHPLTPAVSMITFVLSVSLWYNVLNQFMIQRVLGAKNMYHARMGIVFAGWLKVILPVITIVPGMILFAMKPELLLIEPWGDVKPAADKGYVKLIQELVPAGLRGLFLAALFGAIQSTVNSVLNSTSTIITFDLYRRLWRPQSSDRNLVMVGVVASVVVLAVAIVIGRFIGDLGGGLFEYVISLYVLFAPPFAAVFLLGILWRRVTAPAALATVIVGMAAGLGLKIFLTNSSDYPLWLDSFPNQASILYLISMATCVIVTFLTPPPNPEQVTDQLCMNWKRLNIFSNLGDRWYKSVVFWWLTYSVVIGLLMLYFSGLFFPGVGAK